ncbi:hypothetical protein JIP62_08600 [Brevundimonas vitis]|uniref:Uncharacterized protein n=1 Tax=Brevundimonas vitisensis TaxID=2800818 RepID=A0ABX7BJI9_9CAUL|nr:hypothetical protein [Brevundimonas vitisensis]QQQ17417.1 hypothetical protein JIP62_08600 [Brevundimonas vitisensis]
MAPIPPPKPQKFHKDPRISVNKLAEYLATNKASRRERILRDSKFPPTFQVIRYEPTLELAKRFLVGKVPNTQSLQVAISEYEATLVNGDFEERMKKSNVEAMKLFLGLAPTLDFHEATLTMGEHAPKKLPIADVAVSVRPDVLVTMSKKGAKQSGAIKLNISKGSPHTKDSAEYAGALLRHYLVSQGGDDCDYRCCFTLDIFSKKLVEAPKAITNRLKDAEAACAEIARQWDSIKAA